MILVREALKLGAAPAGRDLRSYLECGKHGANRPERRRVDGARLEVGDEGLRASGTNSEVGLPPAAPPPERADHAAERDVVHAGIVAG